MRLQKHAQSYFGVGGGGGGKVSTDPIPSIILATW